MRRMIFKKPNRKVGRVFIHCSASDFKKHDDVSVMRKWHLERGFDDVGYHFFIKKDGTIQNGRDIEMIPEAQKGNNRRTIAICLHGLKDDKFTTPQFIALKNLCLEIKEAYFGEITFHGHCEVSNRTCPVFNYKEVLQLDESGYCQLPTIEFANHDKSFYDRFIALLHKVFKI